MPKKVPHKNFQIAFLKRIFRLLNPTADPEEIDWEHAVDETLTIPENREKLAEAYPGFRWFKEAQPEKIKEQEELELDIDWLEYVVSEAARPEEREEALRILDELKTRAAKAEELKKEIAKLKKKVKEAPPQPPPPPPPPPTPPKPDIHEIVRSRIEYIRRFKGR